MAAPEGPSRVGRATYPGGARRVPLLPYENTRTRNPTAAPAVPREASWNLPAFAGQAARPSSASQAPMGTASLASNQTRPRSPQAAAFEAWLVKACLDASSAHFANASAAAGAHGAQASATPALVDVEKVAGELEALILKACLAEVGSHVPSAFDGWLTKAAASREATSQCGSIKRPSPPSSVSDVSTTDAFGLNSSDASDLYSAASAVPSDPETSSAPASAPTSSRKSRLGRSDVSRRREQDVAVAVAASDTSTSPTLQGTGPMCASLSRPGHQSLSQTDAIKARQRSLQESERKGGLSFASVASVLVYPWVAASAAASSAMETLGSALALFEDEEWGGSRLEASQSPASDLCSTDGEDSMQGFGGMFPKAHQRPAPPQTAVPGKVAQRLAQSCAKVAGKVPNMKEGAGVTKPVESWEETLRKRRANRAFNRFLDQTRGKLVANRLYTQEEDGPKAPLWQRRGFKSPGSLFMAQRKSTAQKLKLEPDVVKGGKALPAASADSSAESVSSPIWQRRAVGPPTPLTMARRKLPVQVGIRPPQASQVRAH